MKRKFFAVIMVSLCLLLNSCDTAENVITEEPTTIEQSEEKTETEKLPEEQKVEKQNDEEKTQQENTVGIPFSNKDFKNEKYDTILEELTNAGFVNVVSEAQYDLGTGWLDKNKIHKIVSVSVDGQTEFEKDDFFPTDAEIIVTYRDYKINDPSNEYEFVSAATLMAELDNNALNAKETYMNKYVEVKGRVGVIDSSGDYITIYPTNDMFAIQGVQCQVKTEEQKEVIKTISKDSVITVCGEITLVGEVLGYSMDIHRFK